MADIDVVIVNTTNRQPKIVLEAARFPGVRALGRALARRIYLNRRSRLGRCRSQIIGGGIAWGRHLLLRFCYPGASDEKSNRSDANLYATFPAKNKFALFRQD